MIAKQPSSRTCFICGRQNDLGLKINFFNNSQTNKVIANVMIPEHFNGYPGVAHGGIVAAILDETAGRAIMLDGDFNNLFVTLKLEITYKALTPTNQPLVAEGWLIRAGKKSARVASRLLLEDGTVTAQCEAIVVKPPEEIAQKWEPERPFWRVYED